MTLQKWLEKHKLVLNVKLNGDLIGLSKEGKPKTEYKEIDARPWWRATFSHGFASSMITEPVVVGKGYTADEAIYDLIEQAKGKEFVIQWSGTSERFIQWSGTSERFKLSREIEI